MRKARKGEKCLLFAKEKKKLIPCCCKLKPWKQEAYRAFVSVASPQKSRLSWTLCFRVLHSGQPDARIAEHKLKTKGIALWHV